MCNVSDDRQEILAKMSYSLAVALLKILPLEFFVWEMYYNSDTQGKGNLQLTQCED